MIRQILHHFPNHLARKTPKIKHLPFIGWVWLPTWITFEWDFVSPKGTHYTLFGMAWKYNRKMQKEANRTAKNQQKPIIQP